MMVNIEKVDQFSAFYASQRALGVTANVEFRMSSPEVSSGSTADAYVIEQAAFTAPISRKAQFTRQVGQSYEDTHLPQSLVLALMYAAGGAPHSSSKEDFGAAILKRLSHGWSTYETTAVDAFSDPTKSNLEEVIKRARDAGLKQIADRLSELDAIPVEEEALPLSAESAQSFVNYCIVRGKIEGRPLMARTPSGHLEATWKGNNQDRVAIRFFEEGSVWVAYSRDGKTGSFEASLSDLLEKDFYFKIPEWA